MMISETQLLDALGFIAAFAEALDAVAMDRSA
jgi:hypothetical protein